MTLIAKDSGGDFERELEEAGLYKGVCYAMFDVGTHEFEWQGNIKRLRKVLLLFEIPELTYELDTDEGKKTIPITKSKEFTLSLSSKGHLRPFLQSWRGKTFTDEEANGFDLKTVLGANCYINLVHEKSKKTGKTYANIGGINPVKSTEEKIEPSHALVAFDLDEEKKAPENAPKWIQDKINKSVELRDGYNSEAGEPPPLDDEEIPF